MEEGIELVKMIGERVPRDKDSQNLFERLGKYVLKFDQMGEQVESLEHLLDSKEDEIVLLVTKLKEAESQLKEQDAKLTAVQEKLVESERQRLHVENELRDQTRLLEVDMKLEKPDLKENKSVLNKLSKLEDDNRRLRDNIIALEEHLFAIGIDKKDETDSDETKVPSVGKFDGKSVQDITLSAAKTLLLQKKDEAHKLEQTNADLAIRLELEHDRRMRAQNAIVDMEREKSLLRTQLERKHKEFAMKTQDYEETKVGCDFKITKFTDEMKKMEAKFGLSNSEKDKKIHDLHQMNKELIKKLDDLEERYNNQMDMSKTLQTELQVSYEENQCLEKEMEMLNLMFAELEHHIFNPDTALALEVPSIEFVQNGKKVNVDEVLQSAKGVEPSKLLHESCFNEVTTKNGTRMVLSVSKTFIKLKDLILEKKTLEEQLVKMRNINQHLCSQVNLHEEKLWSITDELNNTWNYVSKIKEQHKKLHSAEQILRAELAEKRQILNKLRQELEESRSNWNLMKQKTAESEEQWLALKADLAERKRLLCSSSESGFSDTDTEEANNPNDESSAVESLPGDVSPLPAEDKGEPSKQENQESQESISNNTEDEIPNDNEVDDDDDDDSESIPDPFSDEENSIFDAFNTHTDSAMISSTNTIIDDRIPMDEFNPIPIFLPSVSYLANVPSALLPPLFDQANDKLCEDSSAPVEDLTTESAAPVEEMDDNVRDLITRLMTSTARGVFLANRLSDIHRRIASGDALGESSSWFDEVRDDDEATDVEPTETEDEDNMADEITSVDADEEEFGDSISEASLAQAAPVLEIQLTDARTGPSEGYAAQATIIQTESTSQQPSGRLMMDSNVPVEEEDSQSSAYLELGAVGGQMDDASSRDASEDRDQSGAEQRIPPAPPLPSFSLLPPSAGITVRPTYNDLYLDEDDSEDEERRHRRDSQSPESSTAVTRFLIKHLPKQLAKLRNDKAELEEKIKDLEATVLDQRSMMSEHERRADLERNKSKKLEDILKKLEEVNAASEKHCPPPAPPGKEDSEQLLAFPVVIEKGGLDITWRIHVNNQDLPGYWLTYVAPGSDEEVVLPSQSLEVEADPDAGTMTTTLLSSCAQPGTFTLNIKGTSSRFPQVRISVKESSS